MGNRAWHAGYFADEGEIYEWENEDEDEDQDGTDRPDPEDLDIDDWDYNNQPQKVTAIVATHFSLYVAGTLIADMQRRFGVLPKNLGTGLEPIYGRNALSPDILSVVVKSSESQLTNLGRPGVAPSRRPPPRGESQSRSERATFYDTWGQLIELGIVVTSGIAAWEISQRFNKPPGPPAGGGKVFQARDFRTLRTAPLYSVALKVVQDVVSEAEVQKSVADLIGTPEAIGLYNV
jgi:hypothetical protein